jgi:hypothetical protein
MSHILDWSRRAMEGLMKVLVADKFPEGGLAALRSAGCEVEYAPDVTKEALAEAV